MLPTGPTSRVRSERLWSRVALIAAHVITVLLLWYLEGFTASNWLIGLIASYLSTFLAYMKLIEAHPGYLSTSFCPTANAVAQGYLVTWTHCSICDIDVPLRAKHCKKCNRCVYRFDHHCSIVGSCVGGTNHRAFLAYLIAQSASCVLATIVIARYLWSSLNLLAIPLGLGIVGATCLPVGLLFFHILLAITNTTSWEWLKRDSIPYLENLPEWYNPFDLGTIRNLKQFCMEINNAEEEKSPSWVIEMKENVGRRKVKGATIWNNQYYSCC